jgi:hypothetical protein
MHRHFNKHESYLVLFEHVSGRFWEEKLYEQECEGPQGQRIHVFGV